MKIYVASSWRNPYYPSVVEHLTRRGHECWDWRNPPTGGNGFRWQDCGLSDYEHGDIVPSPVWNRLLKHPTAQAGFASDLAGMNWCDVGVLLHPCGRSAHLEAGWLAGRGKKVHVLAPDQTEPDLMVLALNGGIFSTLNELYAELATS
jgi:hypothetical protein